MKNICSYLAIPAMLALVPVQPVYAADAPSAAAGGLASLIPLLLIFVIFYFLLIRPQQKRVKEHKAMIDSLKKGDQIITGGGIYGKITDVKDDKLIVEIADGVRIKVRRESIGGLARQTSD